MSDTANILPSYSGVVSEPGSFGKLSFVTAETAVIQGRQHKRLIGYSYAGESLHGRTILYKDTYVNTGAVYVYVRHKLDQPGFFRELDFFYYDNLKEYSELLHREFPIFLNVSGLPESHTQRLPYSASTPIAGDLRFFRIDIPFGDVAIEFGKTLEIVDEHAHLHNRRLGRALESPLVGCDLTKSNLLANLLARTHWAAGQIPPSVLQHLITEFISDPVPA